MPDNRPDALAQVRFRKHAATMEALSLPERFRYIFVHNLWGGDESLSGLGSSLAETDVLRREIPRLLSAVEARTLLDIPCGDLRWLSQIDFNIDYTGADIVPELVERNQRTYGRPRRRFLRLDLTRDELPQADVVLCRDCFVHLSFANIFRALVNLQRSGSTYLLTTTFPDAKENLDIQDGDWRTLNFTLPPFSFPEPLTKIVEGCQEAGGAYADKSLALWEIPKLGAFISAASG